MHVMLVEDDSSTLALLEKNIIKWGYDVTTSGNGLDALEIIKNRPIDIIVSDWLMPKMGGLELCEQVRALELPYYVYVILISAQSTRTDVVRGLEGGADDYLVKPLNMQELRARLEIGCRIINLERELDQKFLAIKRNYYQTVRLFIHFLETYDKQLGSHCRRVGKLSLNLARRASSISDDEHPVIEAAGFLHDIGLIGLPRSLFTKPLIELTGEEKNLYHTHPQRGEESLRQVDMLTPVARIVRMHHEQPDGFGFPDGLTGDRIPMGAQIVSAASIYDNLVYLKGISLAEIPEKLHQMRGYIIDTQLVELLLEYNIVQIEAEEKQCDRAISLNELKTGMVLSRDVVMKTGASALPAETRIDNTVVEKLKHFVDLGNITGKVFIYKQV
jgi:response regulator RpfG family c-di-GMP phosphodiesterase